MKGRSDAGLTDRGKNSDSLIDALNLKYASKLTEKGPHSIRAGNIGTTFLVAPIYT